MKLVVYPVLFSHTSWNGYFVSAEIIQTKWGLFGIQVGKDKKKKKNLLAYYAVGM